MKVFTDPARSEESEYSRIQSKQNFSGWEIKSNEAQNYHPTFIFDLLEGVCRALFGVSKPSPFKFWESSGSHKANIRKASVPDSEKTVTHETEIDADFTKNLAVENQAVTQRKLQQNQTKKLGI
jgi:hypothetical protein